MKVYGWELEPEKIRPVREDLFLALYGITRHHPELLLVIGEIAGPCKELIKGIIIYGCTKDHKIILNEVETEINNCYDYRDITNDFIGTGVDFADDLDYDFLHEECHCFYKDAFYTGNYVG